MFEPVRGEPLHPTQHRRRGARLELEPGLQRREAKRHLVDVDGVARSAEAEVLLAQHRVEPAGHVALHRRRHHELPLAVDDLPQRVEHRHPGRLHRLRGVEDPLGGVRPPTTARWPPPPPPGRPAGRHGARHAGSRPDAISSVTSASEPRATPRTTRAHAAPSGPGVLHAEVEEVDIGRSRRRARGPVELVASEPVAQHLLPAHDVLGHHDTSRSATPAPRHSGTHPPSPCVRIRHSGAPRCPRRRRDGQRRARSATGRPVSRATGRTSRGRRSPGPRCGW